MELRATVTTASCGSCRPLDKAVLAVASFVILAGTAVAWTAWRIRAVLTLVLAALGTAGALGAFSLELARAAETAAPLVISAGFIFIALGLLLIGQLFNRLLGPEPD